MSETPAVYNADNAAMLEQVVVNGDLKGMSPAQRLSYYKQVCESLGLNPLTKPFQYITLNGRLTLYATRDATDQLRRRNGVSITALDEREVGDVYIVKATARDNDGRTDTSTGAVSIKGLTGEALANALMKAETKAKRRVTLSIVGLGWLDETETESVPDARPVQVSDAGEIVNAKTLPPIKPPSRTSLIAQLAKAEQAFEAAGLAYTHTTAQVERMSDEDLADYIEELRERYANRGEAQVEQEALV